MHVWDGVWIEIPDSGSVKMRFPGRCLLSPVVTRNKPSHTGGCTSTPSPFGYFQTCSLPRPCVEGGSIPLALLFLGYLLIVVIIIIITPRTFEVVGGQSLGMCSRSQEEQQVFPQEL